MGFQKKTPNGLKFKKSLGISIFLHGALLALLFVGLRGDVEKPAGSGDAGYVSIHLVGDETTKSSPLTAGARELGEKRLRSPATLLGGDEGGEGGQSKILQEIRNKIERQKYYPLVAKRSRIEGSPLIEFKIKSDGSLEYVTLKQSSGSKLLDEAAATTVHQAAPYPFYPDPIALNIHYELDR